MTEFVEGRRIRIAIGELDVIPLMPVAEDALDDGGNGDAFRSRFHENVEMIRGEEGKHASPDPAMFWIANVEGGDRDQAPVRVADFNDEQFMSGSPVFPPLAHPFVA